MTYCTLTDMLYHKDSIDEKKKKDIQGCIAECRTLDGIKIVTCPQRLYDTKYWVGLEEGDECDSKPEISEQCDNESEDEEVENPAEDRSAPIDERGTFSDYVEHSDFELLRYAT